MQYKCCPWDSRPRLLGVGSRKTGHFRKPSAPHDPSPFWGGALILIEQKIWLLRPPHIQQRDILFYSRRPVVEKAILISCTPLLIAAPGQVGERPSGRSCPGTG